MKPMYTQLAFAAALWLALGPTLASGGQDPPWRGRPALASRGHPGLALAGDALATREQGQDALATAGVLKEPVIAIGGPLQPVAAKRQGRLLILTYGSKPTPGALMSFTGPRGEPPRFVIYQGRRQIASGQFEYG